MFGLLDWSESFKRFSWEKISRWISCADEFVEIFKTPFLCIVWSRFQISHDWLRLIKITQKFNWTHSTKIFLLQSLDAHATASPLCGFHLTRLCFVGLKKILKWILEMSLNCFLFRWMCAERSHAGRSSSVCSKLFSFMLHTKKKANTQYRWANGKPQAIKI